MIELKNFAAKTDQGPYLQLNEDNYLADSQNNLFAIFDGFGGSGIGDRATDQIKETLTKFYTKISDDPDSTLPFFYSSHYTIEGNALINSFRLSHNLLLKQNKEKKMSERGGVCGLGASLSDNILTIANIGNNRAYLYRSGKFFNIFSPDNFELLGQDRNMKSRYTMPTSAFGLFELIHINIKELRTAPKDQVILLSDGVYGQLLDDEIKEIIGQTEITQLEKIDDLFDRSNFQGNKDNQTALILSF